MTALGAVLARPEIQQRKAQAHWLMTMSLAEMRARHQAMDELAKAHDGLRCQRRLDLAANDLRKIADDLDQASTQTALEQAWAA